MVAFLLLFAYDYFSTSSLWQVLTKNVRIYAMKRGRSSLAFTLALVIGDAIAILLAYIMAYILRVSLDHTPIARDVSAAGYFESLIVLLPFIIILFSLIGTYHSRPQKKIAQVGRLLTGSFSAMLFMIAIDYFSIDPIFPAKLVPMYGFGLSIVFLSIVRGVIYFERWLQRRRSVGIERVMIIGSNDVARDIVTDIERHGSNYRVHSAIGDRRLKWVTHKTFAEAVTNHSPDIIIQVATADSPTIDYEILQFAQKNFIDFKFVPSEVNDLPDRVELELFMGDIPMMSVSQTTLLGWGRVAKRGFDLAVSSLALIILSPILLIIALVNKIVFGKALFHQTRLTRGNQPFQLYKFQTVRKDLNGLTPEEAFERIGRPELIKKYRDNGDFLEDDPRYGGWSKFLRKTSLDELPQLFNVLIGDISIVGPRALIPEEMNQYEKKHAILNVKSGITGLAQISGRRDLPFEQRRKLDVYYVQNWTFWLDLQIIGRTFLQVLTGRGAK